MSASQLRSTLTVVRVLVLVARGEGKVEEEGDGFLPLYAFKICADSACT